MKEKSNFWLGVVIGLLGGMALGLGFILIFRKLLFDEHYTRFSEHMFAPIFAALFTLVGVLTALFGVYWNIKNQNSLANQRIGRRLIAARASLPLALNELSRICKLHLLQIAHKNQYDTRESMVMSEASHETIRTVIENSDDIIQQELSNLLAYYQIAVSRFNSFVANPPELHDGEEMHRLEVGLIVSWASLRALTGCYFDYGRGAEFELDLKNALSVFKAEVMQYAHEDAVEMVAPVPHFSALSRYIRSKSVEDCGFLDPDYLRKGGLDVK